MLKRPTNKHRDLIGVNLFIAVHEIFINTSVSWSRSLIGRTLCAESLTELIVPPGSITSTKTGW
jgi:hypothetical protein